MFLVITNANVVIYRYTYTVPASLSAGAAGVLGGGSAGLSAAVSVPARMCGRWSACIWCGYLFILFCALADTNYICYCCFMAILLLLSTVLLILLLLTVGTCLRCCWHYCSWCCWHYSSWCCWLLLHGAVDSTLLHGAVECWLYCCCCCRWAGGTPQSLQQQHCLHLLRSSAAEVGHTALLSFNVVHLFRRVFPFQYLWECPGF